MSTRRDARRFAIQILYQADLTGAEPGAVSASWADADRPAPEFAAELVEGVVAHADEIDGLLAAHAEGWTVPRMATLDRAILRVAVFEILHRPDIPTSVAISEAVEVAAELSSAEAKRFVNGVLGRIAEEVALGDPAAPDAQA